MTHSLSPATAACCTHSHWTQCLHSKWADVAMVVCVFSSLAIALTSAMGYFCGIGSGTAAVLSYAMYSISGLFFVGFIIKRVLSHYQKVDIVD